MKLWRKYKSCFLALILIITMAGSGIFVSGAFAEETQNQGTTTTEEKATEEETAQDQATTATEEKATEEETAQDQTTTAAEEKTTEKETEQITQTATTQSEDTSKVVTQSTEDEDQQPFTMECEFDGTKLENDADNETGDWTATQSKTLKVKVTRNEKVDVDKDKKYYICLKVSEMFYFNGLPDKSKITGVNDVKIIKNETPKVNYSTGQKVNLPNFSPYSGEIRLEINPSVEVITITDIGISCNLQLVGYTGGIQEISDPISMSVVKTDASKDMESFTEDDKETITSCQITKEKIRSGSLVGSGLKNTMSTSGFVSDSVNEQDITVGKDGTVSYAGGTAGQNNQVYKELTIVFDCPYIEKDGTKYYLKFDTANDTALTTNKQGSKQGYTMAGNAVYNETDHTITYTFKNIYLGGHTPVFYTPKFSWPDELKDETIPNGTRYQVKGASWTISSQSCYKGASSTLKTKQTPSRYAYYIADQVDIAMTSSHEAQSGQNIAKRYIYKGLSKANGNIGCLGFFDVHNDGTFDSSELNIKFEFNTDEGKGATYYVTSVNIPVYDNANGTSVTYTLTNGKAAEDKTGTKVYGNKSSFTCNVKDLRSDCKVDENYYIKEISYTTKLQKGHKYHAETAHLYRNRSADSGLFFGYIDGDIDSTASAKMTIEAADKTSIITADNKSKIESTEISTVSSDDSIGYGLDTMTIDNGKSQSITAGNSTKLKFGAVISTEEYQLNGTKKVNGYHVFRDGIMYICLPKGVSIAGDEQIEVKQGSRKISAKNVSKIANSTCTVNGVEAEWWQFEADGINADNSSFTVEVQLATDNQMQGLVWDFSNCVGIRVKNQQITWNSAYSNSAVYKGIKELTDNTRPAAIQALGKTFNGDDAASTIGINFYNSSTNVKLNIARAEAKLDVETSLHTADSGKQKELKITNADTEVNYNITIASNDGGYADDFSYYIPIASKDSAIDANGLVAKNEFDLALGEPITIKSLNTGQEVSDEDSPYEVTYTTAKNLNSTTIRGDIEWNSADKFTDYSSITAIKIVTKDNKFIKNGSSYEFVSKLKYKGNNFDQLAGSEVQWRSFGHYTYNRTGATATTNTYPSGDNKITIGYQKDLTDSVDKVILGTADTAQNPASVTKTFDQSFIKEQTIKIKKVEVSQGTILISSDPTKLTGTQANNQFKVTCQINDGDETVLSSGSTNSGEWNVETSGSIISTIKVHYSKAMTDSTTQRYIKITLGNDNIDLTYQINLERNIEAADANGSGIVEGEIYQVPKIDETKSCIISQNSAFTGLYVVKNFVPGNFTNQKLTWKKDDSETNLPSGTTIIMMPISEKNEVEGYWYYKSTGTKSVIDLNEFVKMSGEKKYSYDTTSSSGTTLRYQFVVNFGNADADTGSYKLVFGAVGASFNNVELPVQLKAKTSYSLNIQDGSNGLSKKISYNMEESEGNDSYREGKTLALIVTPEKSDLPKDAYISDGTNRYTRTGDGVFIIPIGTIQSDTKTLTLKADMFPQEQKTYKFSARLYLVNSNDYSKAAQNGDPVGTQQTIEFTKEEKTMPSLKVSGTQVAAASAWSGGQDIKIDMENISGGRQVTVTPYIGLTGTQKATDLLSSVSAIFVLKDGAGTYDASKTATNKLILNSSVKTGTYRLMFEVKDQDGETELSVPYVIIVE